MHTVEGYYILLRNLLRPIKESVIPSNDYEKHSNLGRLLSSFRSARHQHSEEPWRNGHVFQHHWKHEVVMKTIDVMQIVHLSDIYPNVNSIASNEEGNTDHRVSRLFATS